MSAESSFNRIKDFLAGYFTLSGHLVPQDEAEASIREGVSFRGTTMLILIFAIFVGSRGLNPHSTAVIIGGKRISPLLGPINGVGLG
ncbi:MAG: TIGR00341 family protein, partial [Muribaculaceae bacterium]|nr:TIGR00341 family protein [Muribaculaceae bacterium]